MRATPDQLTIPPNKLPWNSSYTSPAAAATTAGYARTAAGNARAAAAT